MGGVKWEKGKNSFSIEYFKGTSASLVFTDSLYQNNGSDTICLAGNFCAVSLAAVIFRLFHIDIGMKKVYDNVKEGFQILEKMG